MKHRGLALVLAVLSVLALAGCGGTKSGSDLESVQKKGYLIVGVNEVPPMNYQDDEGDWVGFDADLAREFAKELGVEVRFQTVGDWDNKHKALESGELDMIWNGMTLTQEVGQQMGTSQPYCSNAQVLVLPADIAQRYATEDSLRALGLVAQKGSSGAAALERRGLVCAAAADQAAALETVAKGEADGCVIDLVMAENQVGEGRKYPELTCGIRLDEEKLVVGARKDSDLLEQFDAFWKAACADGRVDAAAEKYGLSQSVIKF